MTLRRAAVPLVMALAACSSSNIPPTPTKTPGPPPAAAAVDLKTSAVALLEDRPPEAPVALEQGRRQHPGQTASGVHPGGRQVARRDERLVEPAMGRVEHVGVPALRVLELAENRPHGLGTEAKGDPDVT